jgi:prepilin-type processing-associated H-X9-DG protein
MSEHFLTGKTYGVLHARHKGAVNTLWADGHVTSEMTPAGPHFAAYTSTRNPYMAKVFSHKGGGKYNSISDVDPNNNWDRF